MDTRTCIIGAGSSGMVAVKALLDAGVPCDCFEESDRVGGLWVFENPNGKSAAYRSLSINTSRQRMEYADFPMPASYPDYPGHADIARYFQAYADHFELAPHIHFRTRVDHAAPHGEGYRVRLSDGTTRDYTALIVANGHHFHPHFPDPPFPGTFDGITLHSSSYVDPRTPHDLRGRRVVVLGFGNSAVDIASELARSGARVILSTRRGAWVLPKYVLGRPVDQWRVGPSFVPLNVAIRVTELLYPAVVGDLEALGLPKPDHRFGSAHPTLSSELLPLLRSRQITPKPGIAALHGDSVEFSDGTRAPADALVYATGYEIKFPFFDEAFVSAPGNELPLYFRTFHPEQRNLYFVGLAQPLGAIMPIAEAQAKMIADAIAGHYRPPPAREMREAAEAERAAVGRRYVPSRRHTMQVDFDEFMRALRQEHARGRKRASAWAVGRRGE